MRSYAGIAVVALLSGTISGCYLSHGLSDDAPVRRDATSRCGAPSCALASRGRLAVRVEPSMPPLPARFEANAISIDPGADDGIAVVLETCPGGCRRTFLVSRVGSDRADPAILSGPVEVSWRSQALIIRADPCPGCADGGVAAQVLLAAVSGELNSDDLPLRDFRVEEADVACQERSTFSELSRRHRLAFTGPAGRTFVLDEGETRGLGGDHAARVLETSFDCLTPDLPPPNALAASSWILYAVGPR